MANESRSACPRCRGHTATNTFVPFMVRNTDDRIHVDGAQRSAQCAPAELVSFESHQYDLLRGYKGG
jgi:hypothetical protein